MRKFNFPVKEIDTVQDLPTKHRNYKVSNQESRTALSQQVGGDTIVVVYSTDSGDKAYLFPNIHFDDLYLEKVNEESNVIVVYKINNYTD